MRRLKAKEIKEFDEFICKRQKEDDDRFPKLEDILD